MSEWLAMGGYGYFVWSSYGALAVAIALELWQLRRRRARAQARLRELIEEESA